MIRNGIAVLCLGLSVSGCGVWEELLDGHRGDTPDAFQCESVLCGPCAPALTVRFTGTPGQAAPDVTLSTTELSCSSDGTATVCSALGDRVGTYDFEATAPGYLPVQVRADVSAEQPVPEGQVRCCGCGYVPQMVDVKLTEGSTRG